MLDRASVIHEAFLSRVAKEDWPSAKSDTLCEEAGLQKAEAVAIFEAMLTSRVVDRVARVLKEKGVGYYTIASAGHEANAVIGALTRLEDMAFLHYRSGGFFLARAQKVPDLDAAYDIVRSLVAAQSDAISGGRHKVFGSVTLNIPPQTSTIASHLPKALGAAFSIARARALNIKSTLKEDAVVVCSFGDASVNHASAQTTFNACSYLAHAHFPLPLLMICEDNGLGISVPTPDDWIVQSMSHRPGIHYLCCDGLNLADVYQKTKHALHLTRQLKQPVFLHLKLVRLMGHAGSDLELQYRSEAEIIATEQDDPLLHSARVLVASGYLTPQMILQRYQALEERAAEWIARAMKEPGLSSCASVMASLLPKARRPSPPAPLEEALRQRYWGASFLQRGQKRNLCQLINFALMDLLIQYPELVLFGEDVGKKGGVYRVTADLQAKFGPARVFDTLLDETTILGTAIGMAHNGFLPMPEIQFLAYLHNAEDQLRGEAATLSFFSNGQYQNPMVIRIAGLGYQKGFGGHFHNDNSIAVLRDLPGVVVACPCRGDEAVKMLREAVRLAYEEGRVVVFLEPIALYMTKDLHDSGDGLWLSSYPEGDEKIALGDIGVEGAGELAILSYANGYYLSAKAEKILREQHQLNVRLINMRWLSPLPMEAILQALVGVKKILIVDEGRKSGSLSEGLMTELTLQPNASWQLKRITGHDTFIPLGRAWEYILPSEDEIVATALSMMSQ